MNNQQKNKLTARIRLHVWIIIIGLALSGITAFPIQSELAVLVHHAGNSPGMVNQWLLHVYLAVSEANTTYPFLSYGTDWLAFAHLVLAILFIGPLINPVKNVWVVQFGIIAAVLIFPLAFIAGSIRGIPLFWRLIDCSFGIVALIVLLPCYQWIVRLTPGPCPRERGA